MFRSCSNFLSVRNGTSAFLFKFTILNLNPTTMKKLQVLFLILCFSIYAYPQKWVKVWSDEFNTPGLPDSTKWDFESGKGYNNELQYYTYKRSENARIEDTTLIIEARKEIYSGSNYTSARLISRYKGDWLYGKFEFSAKVPGGKGTWPAIWMMPTYDEYGGWPKSGEIDIMEYVGWDANKLYFTTHYEGTNGTGHQSSGSNTSAISQPYNQYIKFTLIWSPTKMEWYANDKKYFTYNKTADNSKVWPFNKMFYLILNLAYGGDWGGQNGIDDTKLPHKFYIDYARVYQLQETAGPFSLTVEPAIGGSVEVSPNQPDYAEGTLVTLTAKPADGYKFTKWLHLGSANPIQIDLSKNWEITPAFQKENELILNGDFSQGLKDWEGLYIYDPTTIAASSSVVDEVYVANITNPGTANWHVVGQQFNLPVTQGTTYNISFDAWSENPNTMDVLLSKNYGDYGNYYTTVKNITTTPQKYIWQLKMNSPSDDNCRFGFGFGKFTGKVYIDNVSIEKVAPTGTTELQQTDGIYVFPNPGSGEISIVSHASEAFPATINLYNLQGQLVSNLFENQLLGSGHQLSFNLKDFRVTKGIYLLTISTQEQKITKKVLIN